MAPDLFWHAFTGCWGQLYAHVYSVQQSRGVDTATRLWCPCGFEHVAEQSLHDSSTAVTEIQLCVLWTSHVTAVSLV